MEVKDISIKLCPNIKYIQICNEKLNLITFIWREEYIDLIQDYKNMKVKKIFISELGLAIVLKDPNN